MARPEQIERLVGTWLVAMRSAKDNAPDALRASREDKPRKATQPPNRVQPVVGTERERAGCRRQKVRMPKKPEIPPPVKWVAAGIPYRRNLTPATWLAGISERDGALARNRRRLAPPTP